MQRFRGTVNDLVGGAAAVWEVCKLKQRNHRVHEYLLDFQLSARLNDLAQLLGRTCRWTWEMGQRDKARQQIWRNLSNFVCELMENWKSSGTEEILRFYSLSPALPPPVSYLDIRLENPCKQDKYKDRNPQQKQTSVDVPIVDPWNNKSRLAQLKYRFLTQL